MLTRVTLIPLPLESTALKYAAVKLRISCTTSSAVPCTTIPLRRTPLIPIRHHERRGAIHEPVFLWLDLSHGLPRRFAARKDCGGATLHRVLARAALCVQNQSQGHGITQPSTAA